MNHKLTAWLLIGAAVLTNVAFFALGSVFNYPDVLNEPVGEVLTTFRDSQSSVAAWFVVLACSAALLAPIAVGVGRLSSSRAMHVAVRLGIAAAVVQVIGLLRWPILVPGYAADANSVAPDIAEAARDSFATANDVLGTIVGETFGYILTAAWTLLVVAALGRRYAGRWFQLLGATSAALVLVGVLSPLELPVIDTANFVGYILWSIWLISLGVLILHHERRRDTAPLPVAAITTAAASSTPLVGHRRSARGLASRNHAAPRLIPRAERGGTARRGTVDGYVGPSAGRAVPPRK